MTRIAVVMPAWNEAAGIGEFIAELNEALHGWDITFVVVDDCSTDDTGDVARALAATGIAVTVHTNDVNRGHGPSTIVALQRGLDSGADIVVAIDGDGQFSGTDVHLVVSAALVPGVEVVEGVRVQRHAPLYRRAVSISTRLMVAAKVGRAPVDANTPLRAYHPATLARLLRELPSDASVPNLQMSALCRRWHLALVEIPVTALPRRGGTPTGTTWGTARRGLPSRRFVSFCAAAGRDWVTWRPR